MKDELAMRLFSRKTITPSVARDQIIALSNFRSGLMKPDRCSEVEPIRTPFDPADIEEPIRWLSKPHGEFFYKKGSPAHLAGEMWNLTHSPNAQFPSPLFTNYWSVGFDRKWANRIGIENIEDFAAEMFRVTGSDFGLLTTEVDLQSKNRKPSVPGQVQSLSYKGLDLEWGVPGLYWINLFSAKLAAWLGLNDLPKNLGKTRALPCGGTLLKFGESAENCRTLDILQQQRLAIEWLGPQKFFDIRFSDRKPDAPNWSEMDRVL
jgi:hypothetical protein